MRSNTAKATAGSILLLVVAMVSFQTGASLAKQMFPGVGAEGAAALRLGIASMILLGVWRPWRRALNAAQGRAVIGYGLSLGAMNLLFYLALQRMPLGLAVTFEFTGPLCLAVATSHRVLDLLWVALAGLGIFLVVWLGRAAGPVDPLGVMFAFGAGGFWAIYILLAQKVGGLLHSGTASALGLLVAAAAVAPIGIAHAGLKLLSPSVLPFAVGAAVFSSALPYWLEMVAFKALQTRTVGVLMSLEPAVAALAGLALLGEHLSSWQWAGIASVIAASLGAAVTGHDGAPPIVE